MLDVAAGQAVPLEQLVDQRRHHGPHDLGELHRQLVVELSVLVDIPHVLAEGGVDASSRIDDPQALGTGPQDRSRRPVAEDCVGDQQAHVVVHLVGRAADLHRDRQDDPLWIGIQAVRGQVDVGQSPATAAAHGIEHAHAAFELHRLEQIGRHTWTDVSGASVDDDLADLGRRGPDLTECRHSGPLRQGGRPAGKPLHPAVSVLVLQAKDVELRVERQIPSEDAGVRKDLFQHVHAPFREHVIVVCPHEFHAPCLRDTDWRIGDADGRDPDRWPIMGWLGHTSLAFKTDESGRQEATKARLSLHKLRPG